MLQQGVPQGSALGPSLFNIYINDLNNVVTNCEKILYADDSLFFHSGKDYDGLIQDLQYDLDKLSNWYEYNKLSVNARKCETIHFAKPKITKKFVRQSLKINNLEVDILVSKSMIT